MGVGERERERAFARGGERESVSRAGGWQRGSSREHLAPSFMCLLPPGPALCKLAGVLFYLKSSLGSSSDLSLTFLCSIFTGFSLPCLLAAAILDSFSLF